MSNPFDFLNSLGLNISAEHKENINEHLKLKVNKKEDVRFLKNPEFDPTGHKLPNQAKFLIMALSEDEPMTYEDWGTSAVDFGMGTKQDPSRIAAYYRKHLETIGAVIRA